MTSHATRIFRRTLQSILVFMTTLCLLLYFASDIRNRVGLTAAAIFATLFVLAVAGEAYSRWWEKKQKLLSTDELAALRNRTALITLGLVMLTLLLAMLFTAKNIPLELLPLFAGVAALFRFAGTMGKR